MIDDQNKLADLSEMLYTISEVSVLLKVNRNYVYKLINQGYLKSIKLGCRKVTRKSLMEFFDNYDGSNLDEVIQKKLYNSDFCAYCRQNIKWADGGQKQIELLKKPVKSRISN